VQIPAAPPGFVKQAAPSLIANAPAAAPARASGAGANSSPANGLTTNEPQEAIVIADRSLPSQPPNSGHADMVERAKSPDFLMPVYKSPASEAAPTQAYNYSGTDLYGPNTRWTISAGGGLMRSVDQGHSWQDVSVVAGAIGAPVSAGASLESATKASHARVAQKDKADQSVHGSPTSAPLVFRAVAANGADVWAGGSTGQLYHSVDYGAHWARVVPFASGIVLTGDIVSLEFTDAQHGRVMTSMAQVWTTADGGTTWQKQ